LDGDADVEIVIEIIGAEDQRTWIAVPKVADHCL